jgi:mono/diheme cytochrome c family protein
LKLELASLVAAALVAIACSDGSDAPAGGDSEQAAAAKRGRQIYQNVCIACHAGDPKQPGSLGPPVAGSSRELLEAKVLRGEYPPGYTPLRPGQAMPRYEYVADRIGDLAAYLQQD